MSAPVRLSVMGAGLIGKRHIEHILARPEAVLSSIVDPMPAARELAVLLNVDWFPSFQDLLSEDRPDGVVHRQFAFASRLAALLLIMAIG
jgi:predicted dehydrogenase